MTSRPYPSIDSQPNFPAIEASTLARWSAEKVFEASVQNRTSGDDGANEFVFTTDLRSPMGFRTTAIC